LDRIRPGLIEGVSRLALTPFDDERGCFCEVFRREWLPGVFPDPIQVNLSLSRMNVLRGLHYHRRQADLWVLLSGRIRAALYDTRSGSPTSGRSDVLEIAGGPHEGLLIPPGVAHGYLALEDSCLLYLVNSYYDGSDEHGVAWDDPGLGIDWGIDDPVLSPRDRANPRLSALTRRDQEGSDGL
jgi:dTDP-4-dehydrorhamnose 3,5-epimerase